MAEDRERFKPDADRYAAAAQDEGDDVEAHRLPPEAEEKVEATEEPPDVEGHRLAPKTKP